MNDFFDPHFDDAPEQFASEGHLTWYRHHKPPVLPAHPVDEVRERLKEAMESVVFSEQAGAWLFRHPPGAGKTYRWCETAKEYWGPVVGCAPTVAEAEKMSEATGIPMLRSMNVDNCQQMEDEADHAPSHRRLHNHIKAGHTASTFCGQCRHLHDCRSTPGQYRYEQAQFAKDCAKGTVRAVTTVKMLEYVSHSLLKSPKRVVIWTDEDLVPHIKGDEDQIDRAELLEWIKHAKNCGMNDAAVAIVETLEAILSSLSPSREKCADTVEDHTTNDGREWMIKPTDMAHLLAMIDEYEAECGAIPNVHPSEHTGEDKEDLPVGSWRPALFARLVGLVRGAAWCHLDKSDSRSIRGVTLNRHLLNLGKLHAVLQSDATASPAIWSSLWRESWRGVIEDAPVRAAYINWYPASVRVSDDRRKLEACTRAIFAHRQYGRCGILTFKAWSDHLVHFLRSRKFKVWKLDDGDLPEGREVDFVIGHFGKHDRGVNGYHKANLSVFYYMGSYRVPMHSRHQQAGAILALGGSTPTKDAETDNRCYPVGVDGVYPDMLANRSMKSADARTNWIADYERGAQLSQAVERIRSVDRADRLSRNEEHGFPIPVLIWGAEACQLTFPIPIYYDPP